MWGVGNAVQLISVYISRIQGDGEDFHTGVSQLPSSLRSQGTVMGEAIGENQDGVLRIRFSAMLATHHISKIICSKNEGRVFHFISHA